MLLSAPAESRNNSLPHNASLEFPHGPRFPVLAHERVKVQAGNILARKPPDKQADSAGSVYRFRLLAVALAPKKGLAASSTNRP
jgi:hypothetical protein